VTYSILSRFKCKWVSKFVNNVNIVYMILSVRLDRFVNVGNLYIMFGITLNVLKLVLYMFGVE
jgi:hypothetical protein